MKRLVLLFAWLALPSLLQAAGGACPTGANYLNPATGASVTLASLGVTNCYYVAANGADTDTGTDELHPWLHAPGMGNCASTCAGVTPTAGVGIILRGGDTWHFGNSSASPYTGSNAPANGSGCDVGQSCGWSIGGPSSAWNGTPSNPIYFGVDPTWYSGSSWARPIMNGDNPLSTSGVANCTYDQSTFAFIKAWSSSTNFIVDNFEFTGLCYSGANNAPAYLHFGLDSVTTTNRWALNNYLHGVMHVTFSCSLSGGEPMGNCLGGPLINGPSESTKGAGDTIAYNVIDGSDSDPHGILVIAYGAYSVHHNILRYVASGDVSNNQHAFHDNWLDHVYGLSDGVAHGKGVENNHEFAADNVFYNNVFSNFFPGGVGCGDVQVWQTPSFTDYTFNNLIYNYGCAASGNYWGLCAYPSSSCPRVTTWTDNMFNNTWVEPSGASGLVPGASVTAVVNFYNNHCIVPGGETGSSCFGVNGGTWNYLTDVVQDPSLASEQGYNASETYAYSPTANGNATVGAGTNETAYCNTMLASNDPILQAAGTACQSDTGYACSYNTGAHSVSCPARASNRRPNRGAWDVGAYEHSSTPSSTISWTTTHQTIDGFGAANAATGASMSSSDEALFFGTGSGQIGLSLLRVGLTNGHYDPGSCLTVSVSCAGPYLRDIKAIESYGGRAYASPFSAPAAYIASGNTECSANESGSYLLPSDYGAFATWIANFVESVAAQGASIYAVDIQNEPEICQSYDSTLYTAAQLDTFIKNYLGPTLASDRVNTLIFMPESSVYSDLSPYGNTCMMDSSCYQYVAGNNWHDYDATYTAPDAVSAALNPWSSSGKKYWMTEVDMPPSGKGTTYDGSMSPNGLETAAFIDDRLVNEDVNAWLYLDIENWFNDGTNDALTQNSSSTTIAKRAYVIGQYAKFIRPGWIRIDATHRPVSGVSVAAFKDPTSAHFAIVAVNFNSSSQNVTFTLSGAPTFTSVSPVLTSSSASLALQSAVSVSSNSFTYTLPASSVMTFIDTPQTAPPVIAPAPGYFPLFPSTIALSSSTSGCVICYGADDRTPTGDRSSGCTRGMTYSGPFGLRCPGEQVIGSPHCTSVQQPSPCTIDIVTFRLQDSCQFQLGWLR